MKQVFVLFVATIAVLSMLKSANAAEPLSDCFGNIVSLNADRVYICLSAAPAKALFEDMNRYLPTHSVNVNDRPYGAFDAITWRKEGAGRVDCYKQIFWSPKTNSKIDDRYSCLFHKEGGPGGNVPFPGGNVPFPSYRR
jgi:hypothetical protein